MNELRVEFWKARQAHHEHLFEPITPEWLNSFDLEQLKRFETLVEPVDNGVGDYIMGVTMTGLTKLGNGAFVAHSMLQPAVNNYYFLFDIRIKQKHWFLITGMSEEEQVAHCLRWGKHD